MPEKESKKEELQKKFMQFQFLQANLQIIKEREDMVVQRLHEMTETKETLEGLKNVKPDDETLIPLGSGNFVTGKITNCEKVLVGMGGGLAIKKPREEAIKFIEERVEEMNTALNELAKETQRTTIELQRLQPELERLASETKKE